MSVKIRAFIAVLLLNAFIAIVVAEEPAQAPPSWPALIAKGMAPYHKMTVSDFPINDGVQPKFAFYLKASLRAELSLHAQAL